MRNLTYRKFREINLSDPFFDSLKDDYAEFPTWFARKEKAGEKAYLFRERGALQGFLYLKNEIGNVVDVVPNLPHGRHLKIGTFKIVGHGTKLGQRFVKKIFDHALSDAMDDAYLTAFAKHEHLIRILQTYGFKETGRKNSSNGEEVVLVKNLKTIKNDVLIDYPIIQKFGAKKHLLAIYPEYHSQFLPDSILNNESFDIVKDVSHANSIHKIYISGIAGTAHMSPGSLLVMYRTSDKKGPAYYRSVATSIGVVEEVRTIKSFPSKEAFIRYVRPYSVFSTEELENYYITKKRHTIIKFTYNIALTRRIIRKRLLEEVGLSSIRRWDFLPLSDAQFDSILSLGQVNENYFVN